MAMAVIPPIPKDVINPKVYRVAYSETCNLKYYYNSLTTECCDEQDENGNWSKVCVKEGNIRDIVKQIIMNQYFPNDGLNEEDVEHDIEWALADSMGGGCELEIL